jgi:hypothetical protein
LLHVKNHQIELEKQLEAARIELAGCSYIDNAPQWMIIFENVKKLSFQVGVVSGELAQLERKIISRSQNRFYFVVYF